MTAEGKVVTGGTFVVLPGEPIRRARLYSGRRASRDGVSGTLQ